MPWPDGGVLVGGVDVAPGGPDGGPGLPGGPGLAARSDTGEVVTGGVRGMTVLGVVVVGGGAVDIGAVASRVLNAASLPMFPARGAAAPALPVGPVFAESPDTIASISLACADCCGAGLVGVGAAATVDEVTGGVCGITVDGVVVVGGGVGGATAWVGGV